MSSKGRKRGTRRIVDKFKLKSWYKVEAPAYITDKDLGETISDEPEKLFGRIIEMARLGIVKDILTDINLKIRFKIVKVEGNICRTEFVGHEIAKEQIRSQIRRNRSRIESIQNVTTKDKAKLRLSTIIVTPLRCGTSSQKKIRKAIQDFLSEKAKETTFESFALNMVNGTYSAEVKSLVNGFFPTVLVDIRKSKVIVLPEGKKIEVAA